MRACRGSHHSWAAVSVCRSCDGVFPPAREWKQLRVTPQLGQSRLGGHFVATTAPNTRPIDVGVGRCGNE